MTDFQLDTSGHVPSVDGGVYYFAELSPFVQGCVEALFAADDHDLQTGRVEDGMRHRFSDLAPETLARIIEDCDRAIVLGQVLTSRNSETGGGSFWRLRQMGAYEFSGTFPPLTVSLNDDGKVVFQ